MKGKVKIRVQQVRLQLEYSGELTISLPNKKPKVYSFTQRVSSPGDHAQWHPFLEINHNGQPLARIEGKVTEDKLEALVPAQLIVVGLFVQMLQIGVEELKSEHGLSSPELSPKVCAASETTIEATVTREVNFDKQQVALLK